MKVAKSRLTSIGKVCVIDASITLGFGYCSKKGIVNKTIMDRTICINSTGIYVECK